MILVRHATLGGMARWTKALVFPFSGALSLVEAPRGVP